jgi:Rrf2 family protein
MPERFLLEILHDLVKRGILRSTRGGGGGFALARSPDEISLLDVIEAVDGPLATGLSASNTMSEPLRNWLRASLDQVAESTRVRLNGITLEHLSAAGSWRPAEIPIPLTTPISIPLVMESEHG